MLVWGVMKWHQPWPFEPPTHLDKSRDPSISVEYGGIDICMDEA